MIEQNQLDEFCNLLSNSVLSEKEIKKKIKYAKTPMEVKHWNKILNEKKRRKRK